MPRPPTEEREAVDALLGAPASGWDGGAARRAPGCLHRGGRPRRARALRHLLLPALQAVQSRVGWISEGALNYVCERLSVPPADAYGVATFYALLSTVPRPKRVLHVCDDIACRCKGRRRAVRRARARPVGPAYHAPHGDHVGSGRDALGLAAQPVPGALRRRRRPRWSPWPGRSRWSGCSGTRTRPVCPGCWRGTSAPSARAAAAAAGRRAIRRFGCSGGWM